MRPLALTLLLALACAPATPPVSAPLAPPPTVADAPDVPVFPPTAQAAAGQGDPCSNGKCPPGLSCISYYGIAGPRGPRMTSCEIPCPSPTDRCPRGQVCVTIADGPGRVCQAQAPQ
ncbi:MAG: hypothetical protein EXR72_16085 [Myxococcales bacterium]|nr:hypothetical protein [Myxococcales bacterium]